jgi:hypothetical protein
MPSLSSVFAKELHNESTTHRVAVSLAPYDQPRRSARPSMRRSRISGIPHFFYHVTTAYGIMRNQGVQLTMGDFLGSWYTT